MIRYIAPLAVVFALATTAHAQVNQIGPNQTVKRIYVTNNGAGGTTTTTIEGPATPVGLAAIDMVANQNLYNYGYGYGQIPTYGANCPPGYGYPGYYVPPTYGYPVPPAPAPYPYGYPPQAYYVPSQTTYLPHPSLGWNPPPSITTLPQVITTPGYPAPGYAPPYNYGWNSRTSVAQGGVTFNRGGFSASIGGGTIVRR